jgi:hypothetical protein
MVKKKKQKQRIYYVCGFCNKRFRNERKAEEHKHLVDGVATNDYKSKKMNVTPT